MNVRRIGTILESVAEWVCRDADEKEKPKEINNEVIITT